MKTVLVVEDNQMIWLCFQRILTKKGGLAAKHTENVAEVIQMAESGEIDIILMDINLANTIYQGKPISGIRITQILKANPRTAKIPVILVSSERVEGDIPPDTEKSRQYFLSQSGADDFIPKPVEDIEQFLALILAKLTPD